MRLWSLHPQYLDRIGLVALWREGLLAQAVLQGKTKGYTRHPQLKRFLEHTDPLEVIGIYLWHVCQEAKTRGYHFSFDKIVKPSDAVKCLSVARGQLGYEFKHLINKTEQRAAAWHQTLFKIKRIHAHPIFHIVAGDIAEWERVKGNQEKRV